MSQNYLYHYTNADSLYHIITSKQFWLTKSNFMNDPEEIEYGLNKYKSEIQKVSKEYTHLFKPMMNWIEGVHNVHDYFILSLSSDGDSLSLWDRYSLGKGYNFSIDINKLIGDIQASNNKLHFMGIYKVNYNKDDQGEYIKYIVAEYLEAQKRNVNFPIDSEETANLMSKAFGSLFSFKQSHYNDEKEIRVIFSLPNIKNLVSEDIWRNNIHFRTVQDCLFPFVKLNFDVDNIIKSIKIGPKNIDNRSLLGLKEFLDKVKLEVEVEKSTISYR